MDIRTISIKSLETMRSTLTTDKEKEFYDAIYTFSKEMHNPACVYHYTNFSALKGILLDKGFRLCRTDGMNDKKEMKNFIELVEKSLKNRFKADSSAIKKIEENLKKKKT